MYFSENDITPGCPEPADVIWMRPRDILAKLVADGESALQN